MINDLKRLIENELEHYIEWPTADKSAVTTVSAKLFAEHVARLWAGHVADTSKMASVMQGEPVGEVRFELGAPSSIYAELYSKSLPRLTPGTQLYAAPEPRPGQNEVIA